MRNTNKVLSVLLALVMMLSVALLAGCHREEASESESASAAATTETKKGFLSDLLKGDKDEEKTEADTTASAKSKTTTTGTRTSKASTTATSAAAAPQSTEAATLTSGLFQISEDYKRNHDYAVAVNTAQNVVTVYRKGLDGNYTQPVKAMACSCGRSGHATPAGQYTTLAKQRWLYLIDGSYGQYCTKFKEHYWFHSVPYYTQDPSNLEYMEYNKLGSNASAGCVRMCVRDVKWVYDNLSIGTVVRVYSSSAPEPLGKPASIRIDTSDANPNRGWDPTDPDPANPY